MEFTPFPNIHWASYSHSCAIVFSPVLVCEVLLFKTNEKTTTHCTNGLKKVYIIFGEGFLKEKKSAVEVWKKWTIFLLLTYFASLILKVPHTRKNEGFFLCFLSCQWVMLYWSYV